MSSPTKNYELTFILSEKATPEDGKRKLAEIQDVVNKLEGQITKDEPWGRRELAYPIKSNLSGYYQTVWFSAPVTAIKEVERHLRLDEEIIRSLVISAYTSAQPGTLYPVVEEKVDKNAPAKEPQASAEEMLRRQTHTAPKKGEDIEELVEEIPEEERLKQLDETLSELLKDQE